MATREPIEFAGTQPMSFRLVAERHEGHEGRFAPNEGHEDVLASDFWPLALWPLASGLWPLASGLWPLALWPLASMFRLPRRTRRRIPAAVVAQLLEV